MDHASGEEARRRPRCAFETRDFYLACFLRCTGYELIDLRAEGSRKVFVFRDRPTRRDDVLAFYGEARQRSAARVRCHHQRHEGAAAQCVMTPRLTDAGDPADRSSARRSIASKGWSWTGFVTVFFDYSISCEIGKDSRRQLVIRGRQSRTNSRSRRMSCRVEAAR